MQGTTAVGDGLVPSRCPAAGVSIAGDHKGRPYELTMQFKGVVAGPPTSREQRPQGTGLSRPAVQAAGVSIAGDYKDRPYDFDQTFNTGRLQAGRSLRSLGC